MELILQNYSFETYRYEAIFFENTVERLKWALKFEYNLVMMVKVWALSWS